MNSVKVLHCADIHIGAQESFLGNAAATRRYETLLTFEKIIQAAKDQKVDLLLIAGDLFDSNKIDTAFSERVFHAISSVPQIKIIFAAGNHDPLTSDSPFTTQKLPENLYVLKTEDTCIPFEDLGVKVYGRSFGSVYMSGSERFSLLPEDNSINIMVLHGDLKSDLNSDYNAITPGFVKNCGMDYIALGHVHKRSDVLKLGKTQFAYCGCPEGQGFDELDEKGVYVGKITKNGCDLTFLPLSKRQHICESIDVSECNSSAEISNLISAVLKQKYGENYTQNLYKIILTGAVAEDLVISIPEILSRICAEVYYAKVLDETTIHLDYEILATESSLKGIFVRRMLEKLNSASEEEKPLLNEALTLGLKAFKSEVGCDED